VSYFQHTERDVTEARLAGRREVAEMFAALLDDTARKLNLDEERDLQYLLEDLLSRGFEVAKNYAADMPKLFPALVDSARAVPAYPLLDAPAAAAQENTIDLTDAIRGAWEAQTFNGIPRHEHVGMPDDKCYHSFSGVRCNHYYGHAVHETDFEQRSK
jgi:hypothetical protein